MIPADFLLIDIGNTAAKLRLADMAALRGTTRRVPTAELAGTGGAEGLRKALAGWRWERVVVSSVVPAAARVVNATLGEVVTVGPKTAAGVNLRGYPGVQTLGADRVANMAGALALYGPGPLIVVDFGTAATFNALDAEGQFLGGVIAPGLRIVADGLTGRAGLLPPVRLGGPFPQAIGRNTQGSLRAGALLGFRGLVREIIAGLRAELGQDTRVVATGGGARRVAPWGALGYAVVDPELTLHGLRVIAARSQPNIPAAKPKARKAQVDGSGTTPAEL